MPKDFKTGFKKAVVGVVAVATLGAFVVPSGLSAVYAEEVKTTTTNVKTESSQANDVDQYLKLEVPIDNENSLDEYVHVVDNKLILELPADKLVSPLVIQNVTDKLNELNSIVEKNGFQIDPVTKSFTYTLKGYVNGKNAVEIHWNFARIYQTKSNCNLIKGGALGGLGVLVALFEVAVPLAVVAGVIMGVLGALEIKGGMWFDFNYFSRTITNFGYQ